MSIIYVRMAFGHEQTNNQEYYWQINNNKKIFKGLCGVLFSNLAKLNTRYQNLEEEVKLAASRFIWWTYVGIGWMFTESYPDVWIVEH